MGGAVTADLTLFPLVCIKTGRENHLSMVRRSLIFFKKFLPTIRPNSTKSDRRKSPCLCNFSKEIFWKKQSHWPEIFRLLSCHQEEVKVRVSQPRTHHKKWKSVRYSTLYFSRKVHVSLRPFSFRLRAETETKSGRHDPHGNEKSFGKNDTGF